MREAPIDAGRDGALLFEILTPEQKTRFLETLDLDFAYGFGDKARFRANYFYKTTGPAAVFRTIPTKVLTLDGAPLPAVDPQPRRAPRRPRPRHRPDRLGQVARRSRR